MKTAWGFLIVGLALLGGKVQAASCNDLAAHSAPGMNISLASIVTPGICRVQGHLSPAPGSQIGFELWLPVSGWNGKFQMVGNGGYSSSLDTRAMTALVSKGYAVAATDTGHNGDDPDFVIGHPEALTDWGYRAVHSTAVAAKTLIGAYYGQAPRYSYFSGCSTGGQQALMEAQRFPTDFDGIIAGDPGNNRTRLNLGFLWLYRQSHRPDGSLIIAPEKLPLITAAALKACADKDGGLPTDGFLTDPARCRFEPRNMACKKGIADKSQCLTAEEIKAVTAIYKGAHNSRTGEQLYYGWPKGSETGWRAYWADPAQPQQPARLNFWRYWIFRDAGWQAQTFDFDLDAARMDQTAIVIDAVNPDLSAFAAAGGKLIQFHGQADPVVPPAESTGYHARVTAALGHDPSAFYRLFMVPGMSHCQGGPGLTSVNAQDALEAWVETGHAPDYLAGIRFKTPNPADGTAFSRPVCAYPAQARYTGQGDSADAANYTCKIAKPR